MQHALHVLFQTPGAAEAALREVKSLSLTDEELHLAVHKKQRVDGDLLASEGDDRKGLLIGLIGGALAGALVGWAMVKPLGLLSLPLGSAVILFTFLGMAVGALGGGLSGAGLVNRNLQKLATAFRPGQTMVTAETDSLRTQDAVKEIFTRHGAIEADDVAPRPAASPGEA